MPDHSQDDLPQLPGDKRWTLNTAALHNFLMVLDIDPDKAAERYEDIRSKLITFFEARRCRFPEEDTDLTIDRVCQKIAGGEPIQQVEAYCFGVAKYVFLESSRKAARREVTLIDFANFPDAVSLDADKEHLDCLEECLDKLPTDQQKLILTYYEKDKREKIDGRQQLAKRLGISVNTLRIRIHRIKELLTACIETCMELGAGSIK
jgi:RNA polymerase sigma factor (sigma-70 family)